MRTKGIILLTVTSLLISGLFAQKSAIKKADKEFDTYDYIDAREIYLKVVENGYSSAQIFKKLGDTYYFNSNYTEAEKWYKRLFNSYPSDMEPVYYHRIAQCLKSTGDYQSSKKMMGTYAGLSASSRMAEIFAKKYPSLDSLANFLSKEYEVKNITESMGGSDFGPSFYGDKLVYASSSNNPEGNKIHKWSGLPYVDLYEASLDNNWKLVNPQPLKGDVNTPYHESTAVFTKDGKTIYFTRNNYIDGKKKRNKQKLVSLKIYKGTKGDDGTWGNIVELPFNSDSHSVAHPALSPDEKRLYFSSNMTGTLGQSDLWYVEIEEDSSYGTPVNLGPGINTEARETFPFISANGNLYFSSDGHLGLGGLDIFMTSLNGKEPNGEIVNLKQPVNTAMDDFGFIIDDEKQEGYFSSNRDGKPGSVSDDLYRVWELCGEITLEGMVSDATTSKPIDGATVDLLDENNHIVEQTTTDNTGNYMFKQFVDCDKQYTVRVEHKDLEYEPTEETLIVPRGSGSLTIDLSLKIPDCAENDLGCRLQLQPIYFDYGKHHIRKDAEVELAKILHALKQYPNLRIHIESHTDSRSSSAFNMQLSEKRSKSTLQWLVSNGISVHRLSAKGYGETQLLNDCTDGVKCSEANHQINRRSVFIIRE